MIHITYINIQLHSRRIQYIDDIDDDILWAKIKRLLKNWATNILIFKE